MFHTLFVMTSLFGASASVRLPVITINLKDEDVVSDIVNIKATATSESAITKVEFSIDDQVRLTVMKPPYRYKWDTIDENEGRHTVIVAAYDTDGKAARKRVKVELDNGLTKGVKPHAAKAIELFWQGDLEQAAISARKAYKINIADYDAIRAMAAGVAAQGDYNRAIDLLEKPVRIQNQDIGDPKLFPLSDRLAIELRGFIRILRAEKAATAAAMLTDLTTAYDFWRKSIPNYQADLLTKFPTSDVSPKALFARGDLLFFHGEYDSALTEYEKVPASAPEKLSGEHRSLLCMLRLGRLREIEDRCLDMIRTKRDTPTTHAIYGTMMFLQKQFARAKSELDPSAATGNLLGIVACAHNDVVTSNPSHSADMVLQALKRAQITPEVQYLVSVNQTDAANLKDSTVSLFAAMRMDPGLLDIYALRGIQLAGLVPTTGYAQALTFFDFVLERDPLHTTARLGKALVLCQQKKFKPAEAITRDLVRESRNSPAVWQVAAAARAGVGDQLGANEALAEARKIDPMRIKETLVPDINVLLLRTLRYHRLPLLTPVLLGLEETGGSAIPPKPKKEDPDDKP